MNTGVFGRFDSYDFEEDDDFKTGLQWMRQHGQQSDSQEWTLKTRMFYYDKRIEPICLEDYLKWSETNHEGRDSDKEPMRSGSPSNVSECEDSLNKEMNSSADHTNCREDDPSKLEAALEVSVDHTDPTPTCNQTAPTDTPEVTDKSLEALGEVAECKEETAPSGNADERSLTFSEIMEYVSSGKEIPGVQKLDVQATLDSPTSSNENRKKKPWEV